MQATTQWWLAVAIFALTYLGLAAGRWPRLRLNRAAIALIGAALVLVTGSLSFSQAVGPRSIDYQTLFLLFGMMVVVGYLRLSGFFTRMGEWSFARVGSPRQLLAAVVILAGVLSAFLVNDIVCLALTPVVLDLVRRLKLNPMPYLIGLATAANIGSVATITGNPQNMIIGAASHLPYLRFASHLMPVAALGLVVDFLLIAWVYRRSLTPDLSKPDLSESASAGAVVRGAQRRGPRIYELRGLHSRTRSEHGAALVAHPLSHRRVHAWMRAKGVTIAAIAVVLFFLGAPIAIVAIAAAAVLLIDRIRSDRLFHEVDWGLLILFIGLFIVVHAFDVHVVSHWPIESWHWLADHPVGMTSVVAAGLSNLVSNVPAVLLLAPIVAALPHDVETQAWLALAMSSTLAGNLTILGSVANLIVVETARRRGVILSFWEYLKVGIPVTLLTLGLGIAWLLLVPYP